MGDKACTECRHLLDRYGECIEEAHDLRNQACDLTLMPDRAKMFEQVLSRVESEAASLKQEITAHQRRCHPQQP